MKYMIIKQIAVDAESPEDAVSKMATGKTISFTVQERPQPIVQGSIMQPPQPTIGKPLLTPTPANP